MTRRFGAVLLAAFALRAGLAVLTERHPLFPPYYYVDAKDYHDTAVRLNEDLLSGHLRSNLTPGKELYTHWTAFLYRRFGPRPLAPKLANAVLGTGVAAVWGLLAVCAAGPGAALPTAALVGLWPSHAYYTSQALKEAATLLALALAVMLFCRALEDESPRRRNAFSAGGAAAGLFLALLRPYLLPPLGLAVAAAALAALRGRTLAPAAAVLLVLSGLAPMAAYKPFKLLLQRPLTTESRYETTDILPRVAPASRSTPGLATPQGLADYRTHLMAIARDWSERETGRPIDTLLFQDERLDTWPRLLAFLPKASFYALFMPLPGLYPMDGKLGRMLSASEGTLLLALFGLALLGLGRSPPRPAGVLLLAFFALAVPAAAFVEFDLGSASRHRLQYLPFLFPFAAAELVRRRGTR